VSRSALLGEPGARRVSPFLFLLVILTFFLAFAGVSCNTATTKSTIGSIEASQGVSAAESAQVSACIDALGGDNILTYSGWQLAFGKDPAIGSVPAACNASNAAATDTSSANIGAQLMVILALVTVCLGLVLAIAGLLGLLAARTRALITAIFGVGAGALLILDQIHVRDVVLAKIASSQGSSAAGFDVASLFNVNPGIGLVLALAILALTVLYNLAALIVVPAPDAVVTPEPPHPPPALSPPPWRSDQAEPPRNGMP
jgi:hypothetical protein